MRDTYGHVRGEPERARGTCMVCMQMQQRCLRLCNQVSMDVAHAINEDDRQQNQSSIQD